MTKILIADDNTQNLYMLETVLKSRGYEVFSARNGIEAISSALNVLPDIIVTDILMPEMDGFQLCRSWKSDERLQHIPFIFYTATYTDSKDEQFALSLGADRFVIKPQQPEVLIQIIKEVLDKPLKARKVPQKASLEDEKDIIQRYNKVLFRKLEHKVLQLEKAIAKQKVIENELRESEHKYRTLITQSLDGVYIANLDGTFLSVNKSMCDTLKYTEEELLSMSIWDIVPEQYKDLHKKRLADILTGKSPNKAAEYIAMGKDGNLHYVEILSAPYYKGKDLIGFQGIARDITERKKAEDHLRFINAMLTTENETSIDGILVVNDKGEILSFNRRFVDMWDIPGEVMESRSDVLLLENVLNKLSNPEHFIEKVNFLYVHKDEKSRDEIVLKDGRTLDRYSSPMLGPNNEYYGRVWYFRDITEFKNAEETLRHSEKNFRNLFENAVAGIYQSTPEGHIINANEAFAKMFGFNSVAEIISKITDIGTQLYANKEDREELIGILAKQEIVESREVKMRYCNGKDLWLSLSLHGVKDNSDKLLRIEGVCVDITDRKQAEEGLKRSFQKLRKTVDSSIQAIAAISETRDPYTAGHQKQVAKLASAIAKEMGFRKEKIEGIYVAGILHDIGKINIPTEILSKPGKLSEIEMSLIKTHPKIGYEILKTLELPWAICPSVLQHHERIDGSGYPSGLLSKDIHIEAKILAVADVVEAMSSHRPYRPALGIGKALDEIAKNKGILYDPDVVNACYTLFYEKGFKLE
jgi:PAS domain S-box-containing protein/putative nucleotidyltransferase with HDIG domain